MAKAEESLKDLDCTKCRKNKSISEFGKSKGRYKKACRKCMAESSKDYYRTKKGLVTKIYNSQIVSSRKRGHLPPSYTKEWLIDWVLKNPEFEKLYTQWKKNGYAVKLVPSIDRLDDYKGYSPYNIRLTTWDENNKKHYSDKKEGRNNKINKAVLQFDKKGNFIAEFHSTVEARRQTGIQQSNIGDCCRGGRPFAGGYKWKYKITDVLDWLMDKDYKFKNITIYKNH